MKPTTFSVFVLITNAVYTSQQTCPDTTRAWCGVGGTQCSDMVGTATCKSYRERGYSCSDLVHNFKACEECTCAPGTWDPDAPAPTVATGTCTGNTASCSSSLSDLQVTSLLRKLNGFRTQHGSCPLTYSTSIADATMQSSGYAQTCEGTQTYNSGGMYTEAIFLVLSTEDVHNFDVSAAPDTWYCKEEGCWDYATSSGQGTALFTAMLWKASTEVGCGVCQKRVGAQNMLFLMCAFSPMGHVRDQYAANVLAAGTTPTGCTAETHDECLQSPCKANYTCTDPDHTQDYTFVCTCVDHPSVSAIGYSPVCANNECSQVTCGRAQTCLDPDKAANSLGDWSCVCDHAPGAATMLGPVVPECPRDECLAKVCGSLSCDDPVPTLDSLLDYVCRCTNGVNATGREPICVVDECTGEPCGLGQTCKDPNTAATSRLDFVCTCIEDIATARTGAAAACERDECTPNPCTGQMCTDPNPSPLSRDDFVCECDNGVKGVGVPAVCDGNECSSSPCGVGQICSEVSPALNDFVCTCDNDATLTSVASAVPRCVLDECATSPCGPTQTCTDHAQSAVSLSDYTCTCLPPSSAKATAAPAVCEAGSHDECSTTPCPGQQCTDPSTTTTSTEDFLCACTTGTGAVAVGAPATCTLDECTSTPCGTSQTCTDLDTRAQSTGDFVCTCLSPATGSSRGSSAQCILDECSVSPCGPAQTCTDPTSTTTATADYSCACNDGSASATGKAALCAIDECATTPCTGMQSCTDTNTSALSVNDFECRCDRNASIVATAANATCSYDECTAKPCDATQSCYDRDQDPSSLGNFRCACDNGVSIEGSIPECFLDECLTRPCGLNQTCEDGNTDANSLNDFRCGCENGTISRVGGAAPCTANECDMLPCGDEQTCIDASDLASDYVCSCIADATKNATGVRVTSCGINECDTSPCSPGQICKDSSTTLLGDYYCYCPSGARNHSAPVSSCDECTDTPCGAFQSCEDPNPSALSRFDFLCSCNNSISATGRPAECEPLGECLVSPCGANQTCSDPNTSLSGDYSCICPGGGVGGRSGCTVDECSSTVPPCGPRQTCRDVNLDWTSTNDFVCTCMDGAEGQRIAGQSIGVAAVCSVAPLGAVPEVINECTNGTIALVCGTQVCSDETGFKVLGDFVCSCSGSSNASNIGSEVASCEEDSDSGTPLWLYLLAGAVGLLFLVLGVMLVRSGLAKPTLPVNEFFKSDSDGGEGGEEEELDKVESLLSSQRYNKPPDADECGSL